MTTSSPRSQGWLRDLAVVFRSPAARRLRRRLVLEALEGRVMLDASHVAGVDTAGNLYVYGEIDGTADLDPSPQIYSVAGPTHYLAKYTPQKELLWAKRADEIFPEADAQFLDVAISSASGQDFVYISEGSVSGSRSIARFQDTGSGLTPLWRNQAGGIGWQIAVGGDGAVYMARNGEDATSNSVALVKWAVNGDLQWVREMVQTQSVWERDLVVVNDGTQESVYLGGFFNGTFAPEGYTGAPLTDQGGTSNIDQDGFVLRYDTDGDFVSVGQFVDAWVEQVSGDASGTYIAGTHYYAALGFPGTRNHDLFFGKLDTSGQGLGLTWVKGVPAVNGSFTVRELLVDSGSLLLTGSFDSPFGDPTDFDPDAGTYNLIAAGRSDIYVASYSANNGTFQWARQMGSDTRAGYAPAERGDSLAVSGTDLYVGGYFDQGLGTFGSDVLANYSGGDGFVTRMDRTSGNHQWVFSVATTVPVLWTIDDGDIGYSESGSGWKNNAKGGFSGDARYHMKGSGSNKAQWAFIGHPAGTYEVLVTWKADSKNASNAAYRVSGTTVTTVTKSQRTAPNDTFSDNVWWESLGTFNVGTDGKLTVTLSDQANGNVVADGVRIVYRGPAAALRAASAPPSENAEALSLRQARPLLARAIASWRARGADTSRLGQIDLAIADLGDDRLAEAAGSTITLDDNAAGWGWNVGRGRKAAGRMDLRAALIHEVGHLLGHDHAEGGVMAETLAPGTRQVAAVRDEAVPVSVALPAPHGLSIEVFRSGRRPKAAARR